MQLPNLHNLQFSCKFWLQKSKELDQIYYSNLLNVLETLLTFFPYLLPFNTDA